LLWTLNNKELFTLEKLLCSSEEPVDFCPSGHSVEIHEAAESVGTTSTALSYPTVPDLDDFVARFYTDYPSCKQFVTDFYTNTTSRNVEEETQDSLNNGMNENISRIELCASISNTLRTEEEAKVWDSEVVPSWESTEDSEDETEYVGETSECETVVTGAYETEEIISSVESDSKTFALLPEDFPSEYSHPGLGENLVFGEHINTGQQSASSSSSSCASHLDFQMKAFESARLTTSAVESQYSESCDHLPYSDTIKIPTSGISGFLLANQVGHESMLASMERITNPRMPDLSPGAGGSLPDGDSREALSVATATLSTLLLSSSNVSPVGDLSNDIEEDSSIQSPLDSGVGTVVSYSDAGSFSDRSPDTASAALLISGETKVTENSGTTQTCCSNSHRSQQQWQVETIPCSCTLTDRAAVSNNFSGCVNQLQNCSAESSSGVSARTGGGACQNFDVGRCFLTVVRTNDDVCDNTLVDGGENIVACQDCFLPVESENVDKGDLISSDVGSFKVLSDGDEVFTNFMSCGENRRERVLCDETTTRNFSPSSSSFRKSSQDTDVLMSHNVCDLSYGATNINNAALHNTDVPQEFKENTDNANGGESYEGTVRLINDVPVMTFHLNGSCKGMVVTSDGRHEQSKTLPRIVVKLEEEQDRGVSEKWFGVANGGGQCSVCSSNSPVGAHSRTPDHLLNGAGNWERLTIKQQSEAHDSGSGCSGQITSHLAQKTAESGRIVGNRKFFFQTSSSQNVASSLSTGSDTNNQPSGSTLAAVPRQTVR
jgi:hypothetical protein